MKQQELREIISGKKLIYMDHHLIDARGGITNERVVLNAVEGA